MIKKLFQSLFPSLLLILTFFMCYTCLDTSTNGFVIPSTLSQESRMIKMSKEEATHLLALYLASFAMSRVLCGVILAIHLRWVILYNFNVECQWLWFLYLYDSHSWKRNWVPESLFGRSLRQKFRVKWWTLRKILLNF